MKSVGTIVGTVGLVAGLLTETGCKSNHASPESVAKSALVAVEEVDKNALQSLWLSSELIRHSWDCESGALDLVLRRTEEGRDDCIRAALSNPEGTDTTLELTGIQETRNHSFSAGDTYRLDAHEYAWRYADEVAEAMRTGANPAKGKSCKTKVSMEFKKFRVKVLASVGNGEKREKDLTMKMMRFGDNGWLLVECGWPHR
ncbi:MAG: hypothetical protein FJ095_21250 [Deltaproteobacteria bacterium]|nr:hypothetical protein [Deltaproteobacteria bacterium]